MTDEPGATKNPELIDNIAVVTPNLEIDAEKRRISLLLPLNETGVVDANILERLLRAGFNPKPEFHVTAFDLKEGLAIAEAFYNLTEAEQAEVMDILAKASTRPWRIRPKNEFYILEKQYKDEAEPRRSVVQMVDCSDISSLYASLNLFGSNGGFEVPPAHLTLATQGNPRGIGIQNRSDLEIFGSRYVFPD